MNEKKPIDLILDTDIGSDSDDVGAMMVLHRLRQTGECNLLAVTSSTSRKDSVAIIDVINRYYGADVPTGNVKGKKCSEGGTHGMYSRAVAFAYGSRYIKEEPENAVTVLRRALAAAKDKVRLVTIGSFANVASLLKSGADGISPLSGAELVERKVSEMYSMAGNFKGVTNFYGYEFVAECNVLLSLEDSIYVAENFPRPIVYSPFELGVKILTGEKLLAGADNPMKMAYYVHNAGPRESWDPVTAYMAVKGEGDFVMKENVCVKVKENGATYFTEGGKDRIAVDFKNAEKTRGGIEDLMSVRDEGESIWIKKS